MMWFMGIIYLVGSIQRKEEGKMRGGEEVRMVGGKREEERKQRWGGALLSFPPPNA